MCACKGNSSSRQVSAVKQVVKTKPQVYSTSQNTNKKVQRRQVIFKRHM